MRTTPAPIPARTSVLVRTMWSYCRYTQRLLATVGEPRSAQERVAGGDGRTAAAARQVQALRRVQIRRPRDRPVVDGRLVDERAVRDLGDDLAVFLHAQDAVVDHVADVRPRAGPTSRRCASTSSSRPFLTTSSMRSCDSESMISYGVMPVSRCGTRLTSISMPVPPRAPISRRRAGQARPRPCPGCRRARRSASPRGRLRAEAFP